MCFVLGTKALIIPQLVAMLCMYLASSVSKLRIYVYYFIRSSSSLKMLYFANICVLL
jgi:hypothetical protein